MAIKTPRLIRNRHGIYAFRLLLPSTTDGVSRRAEQRLSLGTRDPAEARTLALALNAEYESLRSAGTIWTPTAEHVATLRARVSKRSPEHIGSDLSAAALGSSITALRTTSTDLQAQRAHAPLLPVVPEDVLTAYEEHCRGLSANRSSTVLEKRQIVLRLLRFMRVRFGPNVACDLHRITPAHVQAFVAAYRGRKDQAPKAAASASQVDQPTLRPATIVKQVGFLREFFVFSKAIGAVQANPFDALQGTLSKISRGVQRSKKSYAPFTLEELRRIFRADQFARHMSAPDEFWIPLIALYTGARISEIASLAIENFAIDRESGTRYFRVAPTRAKTEHSVRIVPVCAPLVQIGLLRYIEHVHALGAKDLFPNRPRNATRLADPGKHVSRVFARYLDAIGIKDSRRVFHSLRHTMITILARRNVHPTDARLIVGHAPQESAFLRIALDSFASRSVGDVHESTYTHSSAEGLDAISVPARLKSALDSAMQIDIGIEALAEAADRIRKATTMASK